MNREIKFRAWDVAAKLWRNFLYVDVVTGNVSGNDKTEYIITQFTGLKDKNNKDIYEGDILKIRFKVDEHGDMEEIIDVVSFDNGAFCTNEDWFCNWLFAPSITFEVIGNIFENKDLVK